LPLSDPRDVVGGLFTPGVDNQVAPGNLTLDDGTTKARYASQYAMSEQRLTFEFDQRKVDVIFVVGRTGVDPVGADSGIIGYTHHLYVQPVVIDKHGTAGAHSTTATLLADLANQETRRIIRTNLAGSMKTIGHETAVVERLGSTLLWGDRISIDYTQYVSPYGTYTVATRRFANYIQEWRVGFSLAGSLYSSLGPSSGFGRVHIPRSPDPWSEITIPAAATNVAQQMNTGKKLDCWIELRDLAGMEQLLYAQDVVNGVGTSYAIVSGNARNVIGYMAIVINTLDITNASDARAVTATTFTFTKARIGEVVYSFGSVAPLNRVTFNADSVTVTVV
jgi:hypothetical protein